MVMLFTVTRYHIDRGVRGACISCPVALAIAERLPGSQPWVLPAQIQIQRHGRRIEVPTPDAVSAFMRSFDLGEDVQPFAFALPLDE